MSRRLELRRAGCFAALATFVALGWVRMLAEPPLVRTALACLPLLVAVAALLPLRRSRIGEPAATAIAALLLVAATAAGIAIIGLPARLLAPAGWTELREGIDSGFAGIGEGVSYPYDGPNEWSRLIMLVAAPLIAGLAALVTFLPLRRDSVGPRLGGLAVLVAGYGMAATIHGPEHAVPAGLALMAGVLAWIWLPGIERRGTVAAAALLAVAVLAAVPLTSRLQEAEAVVDYKSWSWSAGAGTAFNWDHSYGPIDWERTGDTVMVVQSEEPNYWKTSVLDRFDGLNWERSGLIRPPVELPIDAEPGTVAADLERDWETEARVTVSELRSELVPGPGSGREVLDGIVAESSVDRSILRTPEALSQGDAYEVSGYAPDPSAEQMRAAAWQVPPRLRPMTELLLPDEVGGPIERVTTLGLREGDAERARGVIAGSPYGRVAALAARLTADAPSAYDAVKAIESHLLDNYRYEEDPPERALPLASFLFEDRIGYCQQFSGAMTLMLRTQGIPARIAAGFSPGVPGVGDRFRVRDLDAHSWVEVYFAGIGWVPFDPTPASSPAELRNGGPEAASSAASSLDALLRGGQGFGGPDGGVGVGPGPERGAEPEVLPAGAAGDPSGPPWGPLAVALLAAGGLLLGPGLWRRARERRLGPEVVNEARVTELGLALRRLQFSHSPEATLLDLERSLRSRSEPLAARYVEHLRRARFGREPEKTTPSGRERRALRRRLSSGRGLGGRIAAYRAIPPLSPRR